MPEKTISFCQGKGSISHNNRVFSYKNVDASRTKDNIIYKQESLAEAYSKLFSEPLKKYNEKQKRNDRKINTDYYTHLFGNASQTTVAEGGNNQKSFYEDVVQIGTMADSGVGTKDAPLVAKCLDEYMIGFQERNPNFYVFNAVMHLDEATPGLHIDYVPIGHYKTGLDTQNGLAQALNEMGYGKNKDSINKWRLSERKVLEEICNQHGITISVPKPSRGTFTPEQYKEACREAEQRIEEASTEYEGLQIKNDELKKDNDNLSKTNIDLKNENANIQNTLIDANKTILKAQNAEKVLKPLETKKQALESEIAALERILEPLNGRKLQKAELDKIQPKKGMIGISGITLEDIDNLKATALSVLQRDASYEAQLKADKAEAKKEKEIALRLNFEADSKLKTAKDMLTKAEQKQMNFIAVDKLKKENSENKELLKKYAPAVYASKYSRNGQMSVKTVDKSTQNDGFTIT